MRESGNAHTRTHTLTTHYTHTTHTHTPLHRMKPSASGTEEAHAHRASSESHTPLTPHSLTPQPARRTHHSRQAHPLSFAGFRGGRHHAVRAHSLLGEGGVPPLACYTTTPYACCSSQAARSPRWYSPSRGIALNSTRSFVSTQKRSGQLASAALKGLAIASA